MSFELTNASTTFQKMINDTLREYLNIFVIIYLNDILIYSKTLKKHVEHVQKVLTCLIKKNLRLKSKKCEFHKKKINFLKFVIERHDIKMNLNKITAVQEWKKFTTIKKVQAFLRFVNYNRKFIKDYSKVVVSLIKLTTKDTKWTWTDTEQEAFDKLKQAYAKKSILKMFDTTKSIRMKIDASNLIIKTCLNQKYEEKQHFITYYSKKLSSIEQNYDVHDKKLLIIVAALKNWRVYAEEASSFTIFTNHKNLLHFTITKQLNRRQMRWSELLRQYKFNIQYTSEKENDRANALSRRSDHMKIKKEFHHNILKQNENESLSTNQKEFNATLKIRKNTKKQYSI